MPAAEYADAVLDSAALVSFLRQHDSESIELLLGTADMKAVALVLGGWLAAALNSAGDEKASEVVAGWRAMGEARRTGFADYD